MFKVKLFKRMALILTLSAVCAAGIGCSYTEKAEQKQSSVEEQPEGIMINNSDLSVEVSKNLETTASVIAGTSTTASSTQESSTVNVEADVSPANSAQVSAVTQDTNTGLTVNNNIVQPGNSITIDGFQTVDGANVPITATFKVADIQRSDNAYTALQGSNQDLPKPDNGMEYIVVTFNVTYDNGEADSLDLSENEASLASEKRVFALSNGDSNAEQMTANLRNSIYHLSVKKGDSRQGAVAFLHKADSTEPLNFIGFGNVIRFNITN